MPGGDPTNWTAATWLLAAGVGVAGGLLNRYSHLKQGHFGVVNSMEIMGELCSSAIISVLIFMALESWQPIGVCAAAGGVGGHMGTRLLILIEKAAEAKLKKLIDVEQKPSGDQRRIP